MAAGSGRNGDVTSLAYKIPIGTDVPFIIAAGAFTVPGITYTYSGSTVTGATSNPSAVHRGMAVFEPMPRYSVADWFSPFDRPDVQAVSGALVGAIVGGTIGAGGSTVDSTDGTLYRGVDVLCEFRHMPVCSGLSG